MVIVPFAIAGNNTINAINNVFMKCVIAIIVLVTAIHTLSFTQSSVSAKTCYFTSRLFSALKYECNNRRRGSVLHCGDEYFHRISRFYFLRNGSEIKRYKNA